MPKLRISQVVTANGEGCIALIRGNEIIARFTDWTEARRAYHAARA